MKRFLNKVQKDLIIKNKCRGMTLPELLVVMILSGILFLLLFEGLGIITKYNRILNNRLVMKEELFYSHSTLERFLEETDSARLLDNTILFYKAGEVRRTIHFDTCGLCLSYRGMKDTIFTNSAEWEFRFQKDNEINLDSIFIKTLTHKDTLFLEYAIPCNTHSLHINNTHAANQ